MRYSYEERWEEARKRIEPMVYAMFWQDLDIPGEHAVTYVNWILDRLFRPEYLSALEDKWSIYGSIQGEIVELEANLSYEDAKDFLVKKQGDRISHWIGPSIMP
ncbi:hypothetical protein CH365_15480 [Leptospira neocaledonica]|uniref:Uncharacterized protein n=2 Tax=Leptospira neocaledonica TaxID=2023192 RepID=A0A2M9ZW17_9LEPT|nr:hypothetical protein CH365_15480 [Leptospira neocaledonica]